MIKSSKKYSIILYRNLLFSFCLEIDAQDQWLLVKPPPTFKRKRLSEQEILPPSPPPPPASLDNLDQLLETIAQPANSSEKTPFVFQFGNKRGRPIPPRPPVISSVKVRENLIILIYLIFFLLLLIRLTH